MRLCLIVACAVFCSGAVTSDFVHPLPAQEFDVKVGEVVEVSIPTAAGFTSTGCLIQAPNGDRHALEELDFIEVIDESGIDCGVKIIATEDVGGTWTLIGQATQFGDSGTRTLSFTISIVPGELESIENESKENNETNEEIEKVENTTWLTEITHFTRTEQIIDVSLPNNGQDEICTIVTPKEETIEAGESEITGVEVRSKSNFVSCRISIGPMTTDLLGKWTLCGQREGAEERRCQTVNIEWNNNNIPSSLWDSRIQPSFSHPVNLNGIMTPVVIGSGSLLSCHVITPNGEDLVVSPETEYPSIAHAETQTSGCGVAIGPLTVDMLGEWQLYGMFRSTFGLNEVRLPMNFQLYNEDSPYEQAYNVTVLDATRHVINLGSTISVQITGQGSIDDCEFSAPSGQVYQSNSKKIFEGVNFAIADNVPACGISIGPITEEMLGNWQLVGKFNDGNLFSERQLSFEIILEDPENPIDHVERVVSIVDDRTYNTAIGAEYYITIPSNGLVNGESCHIRTPAGRQYTLMEGFNLEGIQIVEGTNVECGIRFKVESEEMIGDWMLISRATTLSDPIERRLLFKIHVEEHVEPNSADITITEGNDLHLRLKNPTDKQETCKLIAPNSRIAEVDEPNAAYCGFIVRTIASEDSGQWEIQFGDTITYRALINVSVIERSSVAVEDLTFIEGREQNTIVGPADAVFCKLEDPSGITVYEDFGRCVLQLERVSTSHHGVWKMFVGLPGRILLEELTFTVTVRAAGSLQVQTTVRRERPSVVISCSVTSDVEVRACKFRDPSGKILIASQGVGEDEYSSHGSVVTYSSTLSTHECGIRLNNPSEDDLGLWRCGMETETETHYGFLPVLCPWLLQQYPEIEERVVTEPILTADSSSVTTPEGQTTVMSCSVPAAIKYCYFRAQNGTVINVTPGVTSSNNQNVGNGFASGECGVQFNGLLRTDSGRWSCHVGLVGHTDEQRAQITLDVFEPITIRHYIGTRGLKVEANVTSLTGAPLDYCRFVRIDGLGFTNENIPSGYEDRSDLREGRCVLFMQEATMLNLHPWTVAARVHGQEVIRQSTDNLLWREPEPEPQPTVFNFSLLFIVVIAVLLFVLILGIWIGPEKHRRWTFSRVSSWRSSFRNSIHKEKPVQTVQTA